jgi:AbrB family looped-hinge helix DNA binding protein
MSNTAKSDIITFTAKGQVFIPRWLRKEFEIEEGTKTVVTSTPEGILLRPITAKHIKSVRGWLKNSRALESMIEERKREKNH